MGLNSAIVELSKAAACYHLSNHIWCQRIAVGTAPQIQPSKAQTWNNPNTANKAA